MVSNKSRHSLQSLDDMVKWLNANDVSAKALSAWEILHNRVLGFPDGKYLDISNIKASSKGGKIITAIPDDYTVHQSFKIVYKNISSFEIYKNGTGV